MRLFSQFSICLAAGILLIALLTGGSSGVSAQSDGEIMHFSLTVHDGRKVSELDFRGRYVLIQFGYTWCPDVCPMELALMAEVLDGLGAEAEKVQPLFITFDPVRDNAAVLAEYVGNFHPAIIGLTGAEAEITRILESFGVILIRDEAEQEGGSYIFAHSANTYLLGPDGDFRGSIDSLAPPDRVAQGLIEFLREDAAAAE
jgi:protein SCO1/2